MSVPRYEDLSEIRVSDTTSIALQELEEEVAALERQRRHLNDQRALLDLERAKLEQQMAALQLQYAFLDALSAQVDQQEARLASEAEQIRMTGMPGKMLSPGLLNR